MKQTTMFETFEQQRFTRARTTDPNTSHEAAHEVSASGRLNRQCQVVLDALRSADGSTSAEIGKLLDFEGARHVAGRRLPDLETKGLVRRGPPRRCRATGRNAVTWWCV